MLNPAETITRSVEADFAHKKIVAATDGTVLQAEFAMVLHRLEPLPRGSGLKLVYSPGFQPMPKEFMRGAEEGIRNAAQQGILAEGPVTDLCVTLTEFRYHEIDSSEYVFSLAAAEAFRKGLRRAGPKLID